MLNYDVCRLIKPASAVDDWVSGADNKGNHSESNLKIGRKYRAAIIKFLTERKSATVSVIAKSIGLNVKSACHIVQRMTAKGVLKKGDKISEDGKKKAFTYLLVQH